MTGLQGATPARPPRGAATPMPNLKEQGNN